MKICGIDPGMTSGGMALIPGKPADEVILDSFSLKTKPDKRDMRDRNVDPHFTDAIERARVWVPAAAEKVREWQPDVIAIEGFTDQESRAKRRKSNGDQQFDRDRWKTPLVIGMLDLALRQLGYTDEQIFYQNAAILGGLRTEIGVITKANAGRGKRTADVIFPGDHLLSDDHRLKGWCHASWRRERLPV